MCKFDYELCKHVKEVCGCIYIEKEPEYCDDFKRALAKKSIFGKKPAKKVAWGPTLSMVDSGLDCSFNRDMQQYPGGPVIRFQDEEKFRTVVCEHTKEVKQGTHIQCPFHADGWMKIHINQEIINEEWRQYDERDDKKGGRGHAVAEKAKGVLKMILFDEAMR